MQRMFSLFSKTILKKTFPHLKLQNTLKFSSISLHRFSTTDTKINEKESLDFIEAGIFEVLKSAAKCKHEKLSRAATFEELGFDSLDQVELVVAMEEKFNINISDDESLKIQTVLDAIQIMHSNFLKQRADVGSSVEGSSNNQ